MNNHVTDEERSKRIEIVYECITKGMSTRECANYLTANYFSISNATVKDYIERMKYKDKSKYNELQEVMRKNTPKTVKNDIEVRKRVKNVVTLLAASYTFEEIAKMLNETVDTVYRDFSTRLSLLTKEELEILEITEEKINEIKESLKERSMKNLNNGKRKR